ncbi:hypothetical protein NA56DRAFT_150631 [Hyaloscypha hepaticicola]|uniref:Uncharacterized protein n=1 Tax=Hyaloscypha hepaticicola TaxID=2082293 RepID=A0A2J6QNR0_9HELO|nr:hypothetical protein NA56DRAFT_150631 [Hyaloscypha hepaticicola]
MERRNADALVGLPTIQRNYSAAGTRHITPIRHRFARRPSYNSMFVEGFVFDRVQTKEEAARLGNIPTSWLAPAGWHDPKKEDPPEEFWRTLVADRGPNGQNPPSYYRRACRESMLKVSLGNPSNDGNPLDTSQMIDLRTLLHHCRISSKGASSHLEQVLIENKGQPYWLGESGCTARRPDMHLVWMQCTHCSSRAYQVSRTDQEGT